MEIPEGVASIENSMFYGCTGLKKIIIPQSMKNIGYHAFAGSENLIVFGEEGSYAKKFADNFEFLFKPINEWQNVPEAVDIDACQINLNQTSYIYDGTGKEPVVTAKYGKNILELGKDYILVYTNNKDVGTATVTIKGIGNYSGISTKTFEIKNAELPQPPAVTKKPQNIICPKKTFNKSYIDKPFSLNVRGMKGIVTYTSSNKRIATVSKNGKVAIKDTGIVVININASGNNQYKSASVKITINVSPKKPSLQKLKVSGEKKLNVFWKKDKRASGYEIQYSADKNFGKKNVKKTIVKNMAMTTKILTKLKRNQRYYVRICSYKKVKVGGKSKILRSAWCKAKRSGKISSYL